MHRPRRFARLIAATLILMGVLARPAHAYLDPGTTTMIYQMGDFFRLMVEGEGGRVNIAFYSERDVYFRYYEGFSEALLQSWDLESTTSRPTRAIPFLRSTSRASRPSTSRTRSRC